MRCRCSERRTNVAILWVVVVNERLSADDAGLSDRLACDMATWLTTCQLPATSIGRLLPTPQWRSSLCTWRFRSLAAVLTRQHHACNCCMTVIEGRQRTALVLGHWRTGHEVFVLGYYVLRQVLQQLHVHGI